MRKLIVGVVAVAAMVAAACGDGGGGEGRTSGQGAAKSSSFNAITMDDVIQQLTAGGFTVCATHDGGVDAFGAYAQPSWYVMLNAAPCPTPDTSISHAPGDEYLDYFDIVDGAVRGEAFNSAGARDSAVAQHRRLGPQFGLLAYSYGPFLVGAESSAKPNFLDALTKFMNKLPGAKLAYDNR
jgi:hypothetical protein